MKKFPAVFVLLLALGASMFLIACGSSSDDSSDSTAMTGTTASTGTTDSAQGSGKDNTSKTDKASTEAKAPTRSEFIAQADAICTKGDKAIQNAAYAQFGTDSPSKTEIANFVVKTEIPNIEKQSAALRELTPPAGDKATVDSLLDSLDEGIATVKNDPVGSISSGNPLADANKKAQAFGLKKCGRTS